MDESACPKCDGELGEKIEEIVTIREIPQQRPQLEVKAYRVKSRAWLLK